MSEDTTSPHTAIVTADFNITHVTASEFFAQIGDWGEGTEGQPAAGRGAVMPVLCMS